MQENCCGMCKTNKCVAVCRGCQQPFCTRHFIKHRAVLSKQMDEIYEKYNLFQEELNRDVAHHPFFSRIDAWERKSIQQIQDIAEKVRNDLRQCLNEKQTEIRSSFEKIKAELKPNDYIEHDFPKWIKKLNDLQNSVEKRKNIMIVKEKQSKAIIRGIKLILKEQITNSIHITDIDCQPCIESNQEYFQKALGPCHLSQDNRSITHLNYRLGSSHILGKNQYSTGTHRIEFSIVRKGDKNVFFGIISSSNIHSLLFNESMNGWWNFDHVMVNGDSICGNNNENIRTGDQMTLIIDCYHQQIELEHSSTKRRAILSVNLELCPFPWKILIKLVNTSDCVSIL